MDELMPLSEAINIAKQMKHHYRVFERLEDVIELVTHADNLVNEAVRRKQAIEGEHAERLAELARAEAEARARVERALQQAKQAEVGTGELRTRLGDERRALEAAVAAMKHEHEETGKRLAAEHEKRVNDWRGEERSLEARIKELQSALDGLRKRVERL